MHWVVWVPICQMCGGSGDFLLPVGQHTTLTSALSPVWPGKFGAWSGLSYALDRVRWSAPVFAPSSPMCSGRAFAVRNAASNAVARRLARRDAAPNAAARRASRRARRRARRRPLVATTVPVVDLEPLAEHVGHQPVGRHQLG
eukprot:6572660-Prymnesium_polylepis.1